MAGKHSAGARRRAAPTQVPAQQGPRTLGIVDEHVMDVSAVEHRHSGRYLAVRGARVLAESLTEPQGMQRWMCWVVAS